MLDDRSRFVPPNRDELEGRVSDGFEFINSKYEPDWVGRIDLETLDVGNSSLCVGAQLEGSYREFQLEHNLYGQQSVGMGLDMWRGDQPERDMLNEIWKNKISAARA
jgi:hypothetical protein